MALSSAGFCESFGVGRRTATAGTAILVLIPPKPDRKAKLTYFKYTSGATQHTATVMRPLAKTTVKTTAAGAATSLILTRDPGAYAANAVADGRQVPSVADNVIAANDYIVIRRADGVYAAILVSAATVNSDGSVTLTVSALPTGGVLASSVVYFMGIPGDTDPSTGLANESFAPATSATTTYDANGGAMVEALNTGDPLILHSGNATNAGIFEYATAIYGP